jgi:hypothetical protein
MIDPKAVIASERNDNFWIIYFVEHSKSIGMSAKKPGFYRKFIILSNGVYEETGFLVFHHIDYEVL